MLLAAKRRVECQKGGICGGAIALRIASAAIELAA
jgi:hypothetical protein